MVKPSDPSLPPPIPLQFLFQYFAYFAKLRRDVGRCWKFSIAQPEVRPTRLSLPHPFHNRSYLSLTLFEYELFLQLQLFPLLFIFIFIWLNWFPIEEIYFSYKLKLSWDRGNPFWWKEITWRVKVVVPRNVDNFSSFHSSELKK